MSDLLGVKRSRIYKLIADGELTACKIRGRYVISSEAAVRARRQLSATGQSRAVLSRRTILKKAGLAIALGVFWHALDETLHVGEDLLVTRRGNDQEALQLFRELFGSIASDRPFDFTVGQPLYADMGRHGYHVDNWAAGVSLARPLGLPNLRSVRLSSDLDFRRNGDLFVVGGPVSNEETTIAWEFEGDAMNGLRRPAHPILPLRWYWLADRAHPAVANAPLTAYRYEGGGVRANVGWPLMDWDASLDQPRKLWVIECGKETLTVDRAYRDLSLVGKRLPVPRENYLIITRLPNFLDPTFDQVAGLDRAYWPHLLVIEGTNGIGTRAVELLTSGTGLVALQQASDAVRGTGEFQLLFRVTDVAGPPWTTFHRFTAVELVDCHRLDEVTGETFMLAHRCAQARMRPGVAADPRVRSAYPEE